MGLLDHHCQREFGGSPPQPRMRMAIHVNVDIGSPSPSILASCLPVVRSVRTASSPSVVARILAPLSRATELPGEYWPNDLLSLERSPQDEPCCHYHASAACNVRDLRGTAFWRGEWNASPGPFKNFFEAAPDKLWKIMLFRAQAVRTPCRPEITPHTHRWLKPSLFDSQPSLEFAWLRLGQIVSREVEDHLQ